MEIIQERLEREFNLELLTSAPGVRYRVQKTDGESLWIENPQKMPDPAYIHSIEEPFIEATILTTDEFVGPILALATDRRGVQMKEFIPRQMFAVALQAAIGNRVIARETVKAMRKDVLAKCYGGDISRKRKLLEKQKEGKKRMKRVGKVEIPQEAFLAVLKID